MPQQLTLILMLAALLLLSACGGASQTNAPAPTQAPATATPEPTATPLPMQEGGMEHDMEAEGVEDNTQKGGVGHGQELHEQAHGGQVGMARAAAVGGADFHIEIVSDTPGQYLVYLSDENREPVAPEGYKGTLAVINPDGSEIASMPLIVKEDHLIAQGGPTDGSQMDVRITLEGPDLTDVLEMDFTILYE